VQAARHDNAHQRAPRQTACRIGHVRGIDNASIRRLLRRSRRIGKGLHMCVCVRVRERASEREERVGKGKHRTDQRMKCRKQSRIRDIE
jgi:hypothetical protein